MAGDHAEIENADIRDECRPLAILGAALNMYPEIKRRDSQLVVHVVYPRS
jgi:hypothetical protein